MTERLRRQRAKGWRMPPGAVYVGRPSQWGNPFPVDGSWIAWTAVALGYRADKAGRRAAAVALYRAWLTDSDVERGPATADDGSAVEFADGTQATIRELAERFALAVAGRIGPPAPPTQRPDLAPLRGRDLVCWCPLSEPCHADVLLALVAGKVA